MNWTRFLKLFLRNMIILTALTTLVMGAFGFLLAGVTGFRNLAFWGLLLGLTGSFLSGLGILINADYWAKYAGRYGSWWFKKEAEVDGQADSENTADEWPREKKG